MELKGDQDLEGTYNSDDRLKGIWTCSSIGKWISGKTKPSESEPKQDWLKLKSHLEGFSHSRWRQGVKDAREEQRRLREMEDQFEASQM